MIYLVASLAALILIISAIVYFFYINPVRKAKLGIELLSSQETNNRLKKTGNFHADKIVRLFNSLMDRLHAETIRNEEQHSLLSTLIDVYPQGIIMMDYDGRIDEINPAAKEFLQVSDEELLGKRLEELQFELTYKISRIQGDSSIIRISENEIFLCRKISFIDKGFIRSVILIDNMTEEIHRAEKEAYTRLIRITAHEVNNTLGGIRSILSTLGEKEDQDETIIEVLESGMESCDKLSEFVNSYAEVARLPEPDMKLVNVLSLLQAQYPFLQSLAMNRAEIILEIDPEFADAEPEIMADATQIERVIVNIVQNAIDAISDESMGKIRIKCRRVRERNRNMMELIISNNGKPISIPDTSSLFQYSVTDKPGGRGTGLALVAEILNRHHWHYRLATEPDSITRFRITAPMA